jgi:hypothetical protein
MDKEPMLKQQIIESRIGFYWSISVKRRRKPVNSQDRYDYDEVEGSLSGYANSYGEAVNDLQDARRTIEQLLASSTVQPKQLNWKRSEVDENVVL